MFKILVILLIAVGAVCVRGDMYEFSDEYIDKINQEAETWTAGRNFPADQSREFMAPYLTDDTRRIAAPFNASYLRSLDQRLLGDTSDQSILRERDEGSQFVGLSEDIPAEFDARKKWPGCASIGFVPDTGACAAPQVYAAVAAFTDRRCIKYSGHRKETLSTEYVAACCKRCRYVVENVCGKGSVFKTWMFLHYRGSVTGGHHGDNQGCQPSSVQPCSHYGTAPTLPGCETLSRPNLTCHTRCTNENYERGFFSDKHKATIPYWVDDKEDAIKKEIMTHGPTTAAFVLYDDFFHYKSGVYAHSKSAKALEYLQSAKLIGWGVENNTPYWLLINTWGPYWGNKGTVKIRRGKYECAIEYLVAAAIPKS